jgi:hypothetical protein
MGKTPQGQTLSRCHSLGETESFDIPSEPTSTVMRARPRPSEGRRPAEPAATWPPLTGAGKGARGLRLLVDPFRQIAQSLVIEQLFVPKIGVHRERSHRGKLVREPHPLTAWNSTMEILYPIQA